MSTLRVNHNRPLVVALQVTHCVSLLRRTWPPRAAARRMLVGSQRCTFLMFIAAARRLAAVRRWARSDSNRVNSTVIGKIYECTDLANAGEKSQRRRKRLSNREPIKRRLAQELPPRPHKRRFAGVVRTNEGPSRSCFMLDRRFQLPAKAVFHLKGREYRIQNRVIIRRRRRQ